MNDNEQLVVGEVETIYFENPGNFYKVVRISVNHDETDLLLGNEIVITGQFASLHLDTEYQFFGEITNHPKYGEQFKVHRYQQKSPTSKDGLIDYLSSDRFKGIGKVLAGRVIDELGMTAIDDIIADSKALDNVKGLSSKNAAELRKALIEHQGTERIFMQLNVWGFGPNLADKIYRAYESNTIEVIKENPYQLIEDVEGIGFNKADQLAEELGFAAMDIKRVIAAVYISIYDISYQDGDTYVSIPEAIKQARKRLESSRRQLIDDGLIHQGILQAVDKEQIYKLTDNLMIPSLYFAEIGITKRLNEYMKYEDVERFTEDEIDEAIEEVMQMTRITYDQDQKAALKTAIQSPMSIITGGPGTGKTTLINGLIQLHSILHDYELEEAKKKFDNNPILLAAPTGRAAKRMQETTGLPASTIHRLIGYTRESIPEEFYSNELEGSLLIVDEMSMVDTWLMNWLVQAIPYHMQVIFVGDKDQLPSVGPGKVFSDIIESGIMPVLSLTKIYRQAQNSSIIELAHHIREGGLPEDFLEKKNDRTFIPASSIQVGSVVTQIVNMAVNKGFDANNLQVLAPMYKGAAGINALNDILQELLNPAKPKKREITHFNQVYRVGDKVLQLVNNAEDEVYNGDIGRIESIHHKGETESKVDEIVVSFDNDNEIVYRKTDLDQLTLAYCTSIHKAQGSEYALVILPIIDTYSRILQKDLLYTAVTRAQASLILVGNPNSFYKAVSNSRPPRNTFLRDFLKVEFDLVEQDSSEEDVEVNLEEEKIEAEMPTQLTEANMHQIDPMINMGNLSPYDFLEMTEEAIS